MDANLRVRVLVVSAGALLLLPPCPTGESNAYWTLPGGGLEAGQTLAECAAREVWEETGVAVTVGDVAFLRERPWAFRRTDGSEDSGLCLEIYFHAVPVGQHSTPRAENDSAALPLWVPLADATRLTLWPEELRAQVEAFITRPQLIGVSCHSPH